MNRLILLLGLIVCQACAQQPWYGNLEYLGKLPSKLSEVSGLVALENQGLFVIEDNGNKDKIYQINLEAKLIREIKVENGKNHDWEDIAKDNQNNLYIGDFGNNANDRKNLSILKISDEQGFTHDKVSAQKIKFTYSEQKKFPPKKKNLHFDCEAFFHHGNFLYLITKNRARPYTGTAFIYKVPDTPGTYQAQLVGEFTLHAQIASFVLSLGQTFLRMERKLHFWVLVIFGFTPTFPLMILPKEILKLSMYSIEPNRNPSPFWTTRPY